MYKYPAVPIPTTEQLKSISHKFCMNISDDDLKDYKGECEISVIRNILVQTIEIRKTTI